MLRRLPGSRPRVEKASALLDRYGTLFILTFRFLYGIRNVASVVCGLAGYNWARFAVLNFIAAGIWASSFVAAGWFLGALLGVERLFWSIAGIAGLALVFFIIRHRRERARTRAQQAATPGPEAAPAAASAGVTGAVAAAPALVPVPLADAPCHDAARMVRSPEA